MKPNVKTSASRINGRKGHGPQTAIGKAQSCRNALRHGFTLINRHNPTFASEIEEIARRLCGDEKNPLLYEQALVIAECDILLSRVHAYSGGLIARVKDTTALPTTKWRSELKQRHEAFYELFKKSDAVEASYDNVINRGNTDSTELDQLWTAYFRYEADRDEGAAMLVALPDLKRAS